MTADMLVERDVMVTMRDGVRLATDIYRPAAAGGRVPVILERTPYGKTEVSRSELTAADPRPRARGEVAAWFVGHGYAVAYQDCRGRYASEGRFTKYLGEGPDGFDSIAWLARQPWCTGKVGTMGLSYAAHTQMAAACLAPPALACMVLDSGGFSNAFQGGIRQGGAFELKQATWAFKHAALSSAAAAEPWRRRAVEAEDIRAWFTAMPWKPGQSPVRWVPEYEDYLLEQWTHGTFDDYWRQLGIYAAGWYETCADVPMLHMSSWYDAYVRTATENYRALSRAKRGPVKLVMGPWMHGRRSETVFGDVDFGPEATLDGQVAEDHFELRRRWFDRWLKDAPNGAESDPTVRVFVMGGGSGRRTGAGKLDHGGRWRDAADWPLPGTAWRELHLHGDGSLREAVQPASAPALAYDFDPADPVPTIGGAITSGEPVMVGGAFDQHAGPQYFGCREPYLPLAARRDVLVFETPPLEEDLEVVGPIRVILWVATDGPDTDFTAKLIDVHPPSEDDPRGFAMLLTDGILRCRYRDSFSRPVPMVPGEPCCITIEPFATANLFEAGHRLRLDISSSNFPKYDVNPNTGEPEGRGQRRRVAVNTVFVDRDRPSRLVLPVIPRR